MDLTRLPLFSMLTKRAAWLDKRQAVLAQNIANANTPGYAPRDLVPQDFKKLLSPAAPQVALATTNPMHKISSTGRSSAPDEKSKTTFETAIDGNSVVIEEQLFKVSETQTDHRLALNLYAKHVAMLKSVLSRGGA